MKYFLDSRESLENSVGRLSISLNTCFDFSVSGQFINDEATLDTQVCDYVVPHPERPDKLFMGVVSMFIGDGGK